MSHVTNQVPVHPVEAALSQAHISANAQVSGFKGHPNPTLLALMSTGQLSMSALNSSYSVIGFGGE
jgi:hypothetical protein